MIRAHRICQNEREQAMNMTRLAGFRKTESRAYSVLCARFVREPKRVELLSLARVLSTHLCIPLDREAFRRKIILIKWFEENLQLIEPVLNANIIVLDDTGCAVGCDPRITVQTSIST
jgi:hypothetical protein